MPFALGNTSPELTDFEREAITRILIREAPDFLPQLAGIRVSKRELSGVGESVTLSVKNSPPAIHGTQNLGTWLHVDVNGRDLGFILMHENGILDMLEIFVNGFGDYPEPRDARHSWIGE